MAHQNKFNPFLNMEIFNQMSQEDMMENIKLTFAHTVSKINKLSELEYDTRLSNFQGAMRYIVTTDWSPSFLTQDMYVGIREQIAMYKNHCVVIKNYEVAADIRQLEKYVESMFRKMLNLELSKNERFDEPRDGGDALLEAFKAIEDMIDRPLSRALSNMGDITDVDALRMLLGMSIKYGIEDEDAKVLIATIDHVISSGDLTIKDVAKFRSRASKETIEKIFDFDMEPMEPTMEECEEPEENAPTCAPQEPEYEEADQNDAHPEDQDD